MDNQALQQAQQAYRSGDFELAAQLFSAAKDAEEVNGEIDHLLGNSLMRLGRFTEAAQAYASALLDAAYGKRGALLTNQGKALSASGDFRAAVTAFTSATQDASYATPFKAYLGLGGALEKLGNMTEAGVAYRQAAIDGTNPAPAAALARLANCFVVLGRPEDAIESYRTALDFAGPRDDAHALNAGLGVAYVACNRFTDAIDAFGSATADGIYQLTDEQNAAFEQARNFISNNGVAGRAGNTYTNGIDPLDPTGQTGNFMPDPSDTGFFTLSEQEMIQQEHGGATVKRKKRHRGLKIFLIVIALIVVLLGGFGFACTKGFGVPSQQETLTHLFNAVTDNKDTTQYIASNLDDKNKSIIAASIPEGAKAEIEGMDASFATSKASVKVTLKQGGTMRYTVDFVRDGLGWVVSNIQVDFNTD